MEKLAKKISTAVNQTECDERPDFINNTLGENETVVIEWDFVKECESSCSTNLAWDDNNTGYF